eukprot:m.51907 g.51907  ORF g.51907 m.51907 type:complete len:173 (+) comp12658_c1_seq1:449-967(+)
MLRALSLARPSTAARLATAARSLASREGWISVEETGKGRFQNLVSDGRHEVLADEPGTFDGGLDTGMNPYGFLLSALGTCTTMTMRMYATREKIPLEKSRVFVRHNRVWAKDCTECTSKTGKVDVIDMEVELFGSDLTETHRKKLMEIAHRCPVHVTLTTETLVHVKPAESQ